MNRLRKENEAKSIALSAKIDGNNPVDALSEQFAADPSSPTKASAFHNQMAAQSQLAGQEMEEHAGIITQFIDMADSVGGLGNNIRAFMEAKGVSKDDLLELLKGSSLEQAKDIMNDYLQGPQEGQ